MSRPASRLSLTLLTLALSGCWPYLPGSYVDPVLVEADTDTDTDTDTDVEEEVERVDAVTLSGTITRVEPQGDYWADGAPSAEVILGWHARPERSMDPWRQLTTSGLGCELEPDLGVWLDSLDRDVGGPELALRGAVGTDPVPWVGEYGLWYSPDFDPAQIRPGSRVSLLRTTLADAEVVASELALVPPGISFSGPVLDGAEPALVTPGALSWSWSARGEVADRVVLDVAIGDADYRVVERVRCVAELDDGRISIPPAMWSQLDRAEMAYVRLSTATETRSELDALGREAAVIALSTELGAVMFE